MMENRSISLLKEVAGMLAKALPTVFPSPKDALAILRTNEQKLRSARGVWLQGAGYAMTLEEDGEIQIWLSPKVVTRLLAAQH